MFNKSLLLITYDEREQLYSHAEYPGTAHSLLHTHWPHTHSPWSGPEHRRPWCLSQLKLSHSQNSPLTTSSGLSRGRHSHLPQMQSPRLLQRICVVLSDRHPASHSP